MGAGQDEDEGAAGCCLGLSRGGRPRTSVSGGGCAEDGERLGAGSGAVGAGQSGRRCRGVGRSSPGAGVVEEELGRRKAPHAGVKLGEEARRERPLRLGCSWRASWRRRRLGGSRA